jgi:hypothetical protein
MARTFRILFASLAAAMAAFLSGCETTDPPPAETVLWVKLNDSLSRYDLVIVQVLDYQSNELVKTLWNGPLRNPSKDIPGYPLKSLAQKDFVVKVTGYKAMGQLALETLINYVGGTKAVLHTELQPLKPVNGLVMLTPSSGTLGPAFNKDSLNYKLTLPSGVNSVTFVPQAESPSASITLDSQTLASGASSKPITVGTKPDTVDISVTDASTGVSATRNYTVVVFPTLPPGLNLASLKPTAGTLSPPFTPENQIYQLQLPADIDTVAFFLSPSDTKNTTMTIKDKAIFPGAKSQVYHIDPGTPFPVPITVTRGDEMSFYQVTVVRDTR